MNLLSIFFPQTVIKTKSKYNDEIVVIDHVFDRFVRVGGLTQSGGFLKNLWQKALSSLESDIYPKNILVLGLAAGSVISILNKQWPKAKITGVDIDKTVVEVGKKYMDLKQAKNLTIHIADAVSFIQNDSKKYDLILIDLYTGYTIEKRIASKAFLTSIKNHLSKNGMVVCNILPIKKTGFTVSSFEKIFISVFHKNNTKKISTNMFFYGNNTSGK